MPTLQTNKNGDMTQGYSGGKWGRFFSRTFLTEERIVTILTGVQERSGRRDAESR